MSKWVCNLTMDDVPHLSKEDIEEILNSCAPHERDARRKGLPQLGAGLVYPILEEDIIVEPFNVPRKWPRACGLDVGWKKTAAVWGAYDAKSDTWYLYSEYYRGYAEPAVHADALSARGKWMPIIIDSHSNTRAQSGQEALMTTYSRMGLNLNAADNGPNTLEPSILDMFQRLSSGRFKVMSHLTNWLTEFRLYRRDTNGRILREQADHLMDASRFLERSGLQVMEVPPEEDIDEFEKPTPKAINGRSNICGY